LERALVGWPVLARSGQPGSQALDVPILGRFFELGIGTQISSVNFLLAWTMKISRYDEAEGGEIMLEACEVFFRY